MEDLRIAMLGHKKVGKTCFMLGMYSEFRRGIDGFALHAKDPDEDLRLKRDWRKIVQEKIFPPPNDINVQPYSFNLKYGFKTLMGFEWLDYRGGALEGLKGDPDVLKLREHLRGANCLFLCVSGELLAPECSMDLEDIMEKAGIDRMNLLMEENTDPIPTVILITKADYCEGIEKKDLLRNVRELFDPWFTTDNRYIMVCPITLGKDLARMGQAGSISPKHVHLPSIFALYSMLKKKLDEEERRMSWKQQDLESYRGNFLKELWYSDEIASRSRSLEVIEREVAEVNRRLGLLAGHLRKAMIYYKGKELEVASDGNG